MTIRICVFIGLLLAATVIIEPLVYAEPSDDTSDLGDQATPEPESEPQLVPFNPDDLNDPNDPKRFYFDVVVVINKAADAQTIDVYRFGELVKHARVSTGTERAVYPDPNKEHSPTRPYFTQTPVGYFTPWDVSIVHYSKLWQGTPMPWAVFIKGGTATHRSPFEGDGVIDHNIGHRASGGCIRLHEADARDIFWWVRNSGGPYTNEEMNASVRPGEPSFRDEAYERMARGERPYEKWPFVPVMDRYGRVTPDPNNPGKVLSKPGFRTLYIVENFSRNQVVRRPRPRPQEPQYYPQPQYGFDPAGAVQGLFRTLTSPFASGY